MDFADPYHSVVDEQIVIPSADQSGKREVF
jgi:hypothetical protein